jgi:hypothetical protein
MTAANISLEEKYRLTREALVKAGLDMTGGMDALYRDWRRWRDKLESMVPVESVRSRATSSARMRSPHNCLRERGPNCSLNLRGEKHKTERDAMTLPSATRALIMGLDSIVGVADFHNSRWGRGSSLETSM